MLAPFVGWTVLWLAALLLAEWRGFQIGIVVAKPLASAGFLATALAAGAAETPYGIAIGVALALCFLGDVLLIPEGAGRAFLAGLVSFLSGHLAFAVAFGLRGVSTPAAALAAAALVGPVWLVLRWLRPHLPADMRAPVVAYVGVISAMLVTGAGATAAGGPAEILAGALLFYLSDLAVARDRFVAPGFANRLWGLPLYYGAQLLLAASVAA